MSLTFRYRPVILAVACALLAGSLGATLWAQDAATTQDAEPFRAGSITAAATAPTPADAATAPATSSAPAATVPDHGDVGTLLPDGMLVMNFQNASFDAVLSFLSKAGGLTVINDHKIDGRVNVLNRQPVTLDEALAVLDTLLKDRGYAALRVGKTLKIVPLDEAKKALIPVHTGNDPDKIAQSDEVITQVIPIRFADATQLKRDLAPLVPSYADLSSNTSTNTLILTDTSADVRRIVQVIRALDTSVSAVTSVRVFNLKFANAASAATLINNIFKQDQTTTNASGGNSGRSGFFSRFFSGRGGGPGGFGGGMPGAPGGSNEQNNTDTTSRPQTKVNAAADDRTNTLVVSAPTDVMEVIAEVVKELDANPAQDQAVFTYHLLNADAVNVQSIVNALFNPSGSTGASSSNRSSTSSSRTSTSNTNNRSTGGLSSSLNSGTTSNNNTQRTNSFATNPFGSSSAGGRLSANANQTASDLSGQVYAVADTDTNSVIVMTASSNFDRVKAVLSELDRPVPQVLIKVLVVEVTHTNDTDLGVEFSAINLPNSGKTTVFSNLGEAAAITSMATASNPGGLAFKLVESSVTASLAALQKVGKVDVLSRPYILTSDNQAASILVGENVPYPTGVRIDTNDNFNTTVSYKEVGISLSVTPHINPDGLVVMDVNPSITAREDIANGVEISNGVLAPAFSERSAQTRVAIHNGQTIVIGGLMSDSKTQNNNKVPWLADIPILGTLLQRDNNTTSKTELLIFLTPHVAQVPGQLPAMSQEEEDGAPAAHTAVAPGVYEQHKEGLRRGDGTFPPASQPSSPQEQPENLNNQLMEPPPQTQWLPTATPNRGKPAPRHLPR